MFHDQRRFSPRFPISIFSGWLNFFPFTLHGCVIGDITGYAFEFGFPQKIVFGLPFFFPNKSFHCVGFLHPDGVFFHLLVSFPSAGLDVD